MWTNSAYERVLKTSEQKQKFYQEYDSNHDLLDIVSNAFKEKLAISDTSTEAVEAYRDASWPYRQADAIGYKRALKEVIQLLTIRETVNDRPE